MSTTTEDHKELMRREVEAIFNRGNLDRVEEFIAEDYVSHNPAAPEGGGGRDAYREYARAARNAFPDLEVTIEDLVAEGDRVCRRTRTTGTHEGEFMGIPATGNEVEFDGALICRIEDGKVVESWGQNDILGMLAQLGVVDMPGE